jgi:hypothetical protein
VRGYYATGFTDMKTVRTHLKKRRLDLQKKLDSRDNALRPGLPTPVAGTSSNDRLDHLTVCIVLGRQCRREIQL